MIIYRQRGLAVAEVWFNAASSPQSGVDVVHIRGALQPIGGRRNNVSHTVILALSPVTDALWDGMCRENRYEIRRAESKDGVSCVVLARPAVEDLELFVKFFGGFAKEKGLPELSPVAQTIMHGYRAAGCLALTRAVLGEQTLVWHSYFVEGGRCRLLQSASHFRLAKEASFRSLVGRANRLLHWKDMMFFKDCGCTMYDWGGWHAGADPALLRINQFKESFGGTVVKVYEARYGLTLLGQLENAAWRLVQQWRKRKHPQRAEPGQ